MEEPLEPATKAVTGASRNVSVEDTALHSIAVSLKRIADALQPQIVVQGKINENDVEELRRPGRVQSMGGHARAAKLTPKRRSEIARKAAKVRWE